MSMDDKLVSIIMPIYNASEYLSDSIGDLMSQTFRGFELICVDDGSTDASGKMLDEYANKDKRIRVVHQKNQGGGAARNRGMDEAGGKYLLFLDSDDRFEPELIEKSLIRAESDACEVLAFDGDTFDHETGEHRAAPWLLRGSADETGSNPFAIVNTSVWNKLFLREHIIKHGIMFQKNRIVDTMYFTFLGVIYAEKISVLRQKLIHYRTNNHGSIISNSDRYPMEAYNAFLAVKYKLEDDEIFDEKSEVFKNYAAEYLTDRLRIMRTAAGFTALYKVLHEGGLIKLGFSSDELKRSNEIHYRTLLNVMKKNVSEFLFDNRREITDSGLLRRECYILPKINTANEMLEVVLYGGGDVGRDFFMQLMARADIRLISWVDANYEKIGYPLQAPYILKDIKFDLVLVAVSNAKTADKIKDGLSEMGISDKKILWEQPYRI